VDRTTSDVLAASVDELAADVLGVELSVVEAGFPDEHAASAQNDIAVPKTIRDLHVTVMLHLR